MPNLTGASITFHTHDDDKDHGTVVHVFVKNRPNTTQGSEQSDFVSNLLEFQRYLDSGDLGDHTGGPYLAYGVGLAVSGFDNPSTNSFPLTLMPDPISIDDVVLPAVNIHIQTHGNDRWIFDYTLRLTFDDGSDYRFSSTDLPGLRGIILDQDNPTYSGICAENPFRPVPARDRPVSGAFLRKVTVDFLTHDDNKDFDTRLDVEIVNRLDATNHQGIALGVDLFPGVEFVDHESMRSVSWPSDDGNLTLNQIALADMVLPEVIVTIHPNGDDRWIFDYRVTYEFGDPDEFGGKRTFYTYRTGGIILDQDNNRHIGVYQGPALPTVVARPAAPLVDVPIDQVALFKTIPLSVVRQKFAEFINSRNGSVNDHNPPLRRIRLHNTGSYVDGTIPESYVDIRSITAGRDTVNYVSSPISLGQLGVDGLGDLYLRDINSAALSISVDPTQPTPFTLTVDFETGGPEEVAGGLLGLFNMDFTQFSIALRLTLQLGHTVDEDGTERTVIDVLHWAEELRDMRVTVDHFSEGIAFFRYVGTFLGEPVDLVSPLSMNSLFVEQVIVVTLVTSEGVDLGGSFRKRIRNEAFSKLTTADKFTGRTARDGINSMVTSWLLGGVADDARDTDGNNTLLSDVAIRDDAIVIAYTGPRRVFAPPTPPDWPTTSHPSTTFDFSPGTLSNIDHIVVLTMENRSFDHMLGYLSLPAAQGGMGRSDIDGLTGSESNVHRGTAYPSFALTGTFFSPDPPHGFEPTHRAINGGRMDGFVQAFAEQNGPGTAGQIMGHHTARTVPEYDALARDFAVGHRWFASHPGPTFTNRFYELTGRLNLDDHGFWEFDNSSPLRPVFTPTIFDYLSQARDPATGAPVTWSYYEHGYCFLRFFERYTFDDTHIVSIDDPQRGFFAQAKSGDLPSVSFIDPRFVELPPDSNADGAPVDVKAGQDLVKRVVEAVVAGPAWERTLLIIVYDEHGGFFDHVPPPTAIRVSPEVPVDTYGVRVPAFVISPWVGAGSVFGGDGQVFDHTSILKTIARRFMSKNPPFLGSRYAAANDLSAVLGSQRRSTLFRPFLRYTARFGQTPFMLGVKDADPTAGAALWQLSADGSAAQGFSFEDAGDGLWYIRNQVSNLYLTVQLPNPVPPGGKPILPTVVQDVKVVPGAASGAASTATQIGVPAVDRQRWALVPVTGPDTGPDRYLIRSRAVPGKVLQPSDASRPSAVVLGNLPLGSPPGTNNWTVTSPLLG